MQSIPNPSPIATHRSRHAPQRAFYYLFMSLYNTDLFSPCMSRGPPLRTLLVDFGGKKIFISHPIISAISFTNSKEKFPVLSLLANACLDIDFVKLLAIYSADNLHLARCSLISRPICFIVAPPHCSVIYWLT